MPEGRNAPVEVWCSMKGKLKRAGWDDHFLVTLLTQFASPQMR